MLFPRAGSTPVNDVSVRVFLTIVMVVLVAMNLLPKARRMPFPRPRLIDGLLLVFVATLWLLLVSPFIGGTNADVISGLYFAGWDNHGHYTTFANTYMSESTTWPTTDGSVAWNQWYPSLHSTLWALGTFLVSGAGLDRVGLLIPYVQWSAVTFVMSIGAAWVATDIAERWVKELRDDERCGQVVSRLVSLLRGYSLAVRNSFSMRVHKLRHGCRIDGDGKLPGGSFAERSTDSRMVHRSSCGRRNDWIVDARSGPGACRCDRGGRHDPPPSDAGRYLACRDSRDRPSRFISATRRCAKRWRTGGCSGVCAEHRRGPGMAPST